MVDDHPLLRSALRQMLGAQADLEVVGEAADGQQALELCRRLRPRSGLDGRVDAPEWAAWRPPGG